MVAQVVDLRLTSAGEKKLKLKKNGHLYNLKAGSRWESPLWKVWDLRTDPQWDELFKRYAPLDPRPEDRARIRPTRRGAPWRRCLAVARNVGAVVAVAEKRYVDRDYRSEYGALYSQVLAPIPDTAHRLHFFSEYVSDEDMSRLNEDTSIPARLGDSYLGYVVCRPAPLELVGRTMLKPPRKVSVRSAIREPVAFFGVQLVAEGVPFMQQDQRLGVCAHVATWSLIYAADRCGDSAHHTIADIVRIAHGSADGRLGLTDSQVVATLQDAGLRPQMLSVDVDLPPAHKYPWTTEQAAEPHDDNRPSFFVGPQEEHQLEADLAQVIVPMLNSGVSVYVGGSGHAFTVCGYSTRNVACANGDKSRVVYTVHDDQVGPYIQIYSPARDFAALRQAQVPEEFSRESIEEAMSSFCWAVEPDKIREAVAAHRQRDLATLTDRQIAATRSRWEAVVLPAPGNVHLSFKVAEDVAIQEFDKTIREYKKSNYPALKLGPKPDQSSASNDVEHDEVDIVGLFNEGHLRVRTYFSKSTTFKSGLKRRGIPDDVASEYRRCRFAANVHVVELVDASRPSTEPRVLGEIIFDSTSGDSHPWIHAVRILHSLEITKSSGELLTGAPSFRLSRVGFPGARSGPGRSDPLLAKP